VTLLLTRFRFYVLRVYKNTIVACPRRSNLPGGGQDCWLAKCQDWWTAVSHSAEARLCHEHDVLAHCLAGRHTHLQQCCGSLVPASASATCLGNIARWLLLHAQRRWGLHSRVWILQKRVYRIPVRNMDGCNMAEFQQSVVERNITFSQIKKFCILQDSAMTFFRCGGYGVTVCFSSEVT